MLLELLLQMLKLQAYIIWDGAVLVFFSPINCFQKSKGGMVLEVILHLFVPFFSLAFYSIYFVLISMCNIFI